VGTHGEVAADECVLTVPFVLLRHMEIDGLDPDKWFTIRNVYYGRAHKIFMQFSRRWWADDYAISHGVTVTDLAIRNVVYTPAGQDPSTDRACSSRLRLGAGQHGLQHARRGQRIARRSRTWSGSTPRLATRSSSASRTTGRSIDTGAASVRSSGLSR
jgi:monoamine oxidase